ncbi:YceI family protein [candidate division WWE3 bacterium]|uniref:YceI family protein n=1 Tax=candidate division WWE3 bacterium TaxID=2053526 RepID=A0A955ECQ9_UNCKA|nr:YceI family protein [candidate division WWE3 bacterium]
MNKKALTYIIPLLVLVPAGLLVYNLMTQKNEPAQVAITNIDTEKPNGDDAMMLKETPELTLDDLGVFNADVPASANRYVVSSGSATFVAQKRFLQKEDDEVVGTTEDVKGAGWFDAATGDSYFKTEVGLAKIPTDSPNRDADIQKTLFAVKIASFEFDSTGVEGTLEEGLVDTNVTGTLTINDTPQQVTFAVTGELTNETFTAEGTTTIKISDFGLTVPSLANVYTVDDEVEITFEVTANRVEATAESTTEDAMMLKDEDPAATDLDVLDEE